MKLPTSPTAKYFCKPHFKRNPMYIAVAKPIYSVAAEWTQDNKADSSKQFFYLLKFSTRGDQQDLIDDLTSEFGTHGDRWYWDSVNDHGRLGETTVTIVFSNYEDAVTFKFLHS